MRTAALLKTLLEEVPEHFEVPIVVVLTP